MFRELETEVEVKARLRSTGASLRRLLREVPHETEKGRISAIELTLGVCCFMQGTMLRSVFIISISSKDSWIIAFTGLLFFLPCLVIYATW